MENRKERCIILCQPKRIYIYIHIYIHIHICVCVCVCVCVCTYLYENTYKINDKWLNFTSDVVVSRHVQYTMCVYVRKWEGKCRCHIKGTYSEKQKRAFYKSSIRNKNYLQTQKLFKTCRSCFRLRDPLRQSILRYHRSCIHLTY